ncbi:hypothetical protein VUJ46_19035 [Chryseobacterium sp. MYb264]|uniref:hypothetical protein n=1 Tax=Chryseobacterium sp. MYb264 TaxID=2745153 RepID=UPI002E0E6A05|nr:hypothetical protein VUJ46_19035 [Chryseobacterium sp. MYb264]
MKKSELENKYTFLNKLLEEFYDVQYEYKNAKSNSKKNVESRLSTLINRAENYIESDDTLYNIVTVGKTEYERMISIEESFTLRNFSRDMPEILSRLKNFIENLE